MSPLNCPIDEHRDYRKMTYSWRKPHYNEKELEIVRNFFTDTEWKAIEESTEVDSIYLKIHNLFKKFH